MHSLSSYFLLVFVASNDDVDANAWLTLPERVIDEEEEKFNTLFIFVEVFVEELTTNLRKYGTKTVSVMTRKHMAKDKHYCMVANGRRTLIKYTNRFKNFMSSACEMYLLFVHDTINKRAATPHNAPSTVHIRDR